MAYVKTTWATGDKITAVKLNNMESGIEAANAVPFKYITATFADGALTVSDTYANTKAAYLDGAIIFCNIIFSDAIVETCRATAYDSGSDFLVFASAVLLEGGGHLQTYTFDANGFALVTGGGGEG